MVQYSALLTMANWYEVYRIFHFQ